MQDFFFFLTLLRYRTATTPHKVPIKRSNSGADVVLILAGSI